ncbi:hypothetical protein A3J13_02340 [Candidatus Daviesbacteria bacterium RIFCSPLOWO2_02_FULL_36_8]|uniref:riboflavin kinase n=1 Tax=Candidatus Daviesbacteria bacterium RIFCSPLOWO2_02_FULL_36_8 TaxID=1797793 RepID=A0A1F5MFE2_9BACT|nr:MAG: hypothetical protein A3J13_02340 [Candidatus Daviesbacteria bacterium RIFCSPLOWO2_02_FULL_36_8]
MYKFWGKVRIDHQRGKDLGFPTANVNLSKSIPEGIYISKTKIGDMKYKSLSFIGKVKTFEGKKYQSETYILDFSKNIYGKWISVDLIKKIRENKKFSSAKDLVVQMKKDEEVARKYLGI